MNDERRREGETENINELGRGRKKERKKMTAQRL